MYLAYVLYAAQVAQILGEQLLKSHPLPTRTELLRAVQKRLRIAADGKHGRYCFLRHVCGLPEKTVRVNVGTRNFSGGKRVDPIEKIPSHQAVATSLVYVQPRTSGHCDLETSSVAIYIERALEHLLPARELVYLVENDRALSGQLLLLGKRKCLSYGVAAALYQCKSVRCVV